MNYQYAIRIRTNHDSSGDMGAVRAAVKAALPRLAAKVGATRHEVWRSLREQAAGGAAEWSSEMSPVAMATGLLSSVIISLHVLSGDDAWQSLATADAAFLIVEESPRRIHRTLTRLQREQAMEHRRAVAA